MALITSRTGLNQGASNIVASVVFAAGTTGEIRIHTSASNLLPALADGEFFEIRDHTDTANNGLYQVETVTTSTDDYECDKISSGTAIVAGAETVEVLGATGSEKNVHLDVINKLVYLIEQDTLDAFGVNGDAVYSFFMQEWKDDNFIIANSPFPMNAIDKDAGKYIMGQDSSGNSNGWNWADTATYNTVEIRTRKMLRNMGWDEIDVNGNTIAREFCAITLGVFEDSTPLTGDLPYGQFGTDSSLDDTFDFLFTGPANEAIRFYEEQAQTDLAITTTTITRVGGDFVAEGYKVGGQVTIRAAGNSLNDSTFVLTAVSATVLTTTGLTTDAADTTARLSVDNDNAFKIGIRVRDGDTNGKTFGQSNLAGAGKTILGNFVFSFPLANATDLKITNTDAFIDGANPPFNGMTLTLNATGQSRGGLVGGPFNFSMILDGNNGTNVECFEWLQRQLRKNSDIDSGGTNFGRALELMARFNGDTAEFGSPDGGVNFPLNPESGLDGGLFIDNLNAASDNATKFWDDTGTLRSKPESIAITLDGNSIITTGDAASEYDLYFDRTERTITDNTLVVTAGTLATGTLVSTAQFPTLVNGVGAYIRISGLTGADEPMNGVYQVTAETSTSLWSITRYDGATIVTTAGEIGNIDENCVDTPDAIIAHTNVSVATSADVSFTAADTITSAGSEFGVFAVGDRIEIEGSTSGLNDGLWEVLTASATVLTVSPERTQPASITTQGTGPTVTITKLFSGDFDADVVANFAFDDNVQGGRDVSTTTYFQAKAIGAATAQYIQSPVSTLSSGTPLTIPLFASTERNYS